MLDDRATGIKNTLDEARLLREEAKALLASYEAKQREVIAQSARIVATAKTEAQAAANQAKLDLQASIARRLLAAEEQLDSSVKAAERAVRDQAISVSVAVAADVLKRQMTADQAAAAIDSSIAQVAAKLH
jgi:F-type H+-transporting ATPase subunit b